MKFLCALPESHHYRSIQSTTEGVWLWEDKGTKALRVRSPVPNPWTQQWVIIPTAAKQKSDKAEYPARLILRLYPPSDNAIACFIERERIKSVYAWADHQPLAFYAFPVDQLYWIFYSFYAPQSKQEIDRQSL